MDAGLNYLDRPLDDCVWEVKVLVTGGRDYQCQDTVDRTLNAIHDKSPIELLINGGAKGADTLCQHWAKLAGVRIHTQMAEWAKHGKAAGPMRNVAMLTMKPDLLVAFPGGKGTEHMVKTATSLGMKVVHSAPEPAPQSPPQPNNGN